MNFVDTFLNLVAKYSGKVATAEQWWKEVHTYYSSPGRYYHNLAHLNQVFQQLQKVKDSIADWDTMIFALAYHDFIYQPLKQRNEENSAAFAVKKLQSIGYDPERIDLCSRIILATLEHDKSEIMDINYFVDADLSILASDWITYQVYTKAIRKEFSIYPDFIYYPGRRQVVKRFLNMERIFKTDFFHEEFDTAARENLNRELKEL